MAPLLVFIAVLVPVLSASAAPSPAASGTQHAALSDVDEVSSRGRVVLVNGVPFFPLMAWEQCPRSFDQLLTLGINVLMGTCEQADLKTTLEMLSTNTYLVLPVGTEPATPVPNLIGWHHPDEADGYGIPSKALSSRPKDGLTFLTLSPRFAFRLDPVSTTFTKDLYLAYFKAADVAGFNLYPLQKWCGQPEVNLFDVYGIQRELNALVPGKPTYQWIETGPLEGECLGRVQL